jgi:hypothetical protein
MHHWRSKMGVSAHCKRDMRHIRRVVWLPIWHFSHRREKPALIVWVPHRRLFGLGRVAHTLFGCRHKRAMVTPFVRVVRLSGSAN